MQEVIIGVRPQDIILDRTILEGAKKSNVFTGEIQQVENIGHERKYILQIPELENSFVVTSSNQYLINEVGKKIRFYINPSRIHIFDAETGISLSSVINKETRKAHAIWTQSTQERIKNMILLDDEKNKEKFSKKIVKDFLGYLLPTYGRQRRLFKMERKIKKYKDVSIVDVIKQTGN